MLVGRDTRASGPGLERRLAAGLASRRVDVARSAACSRRPRSRFSPGDGGAVVSASHNPAEYNGVKFFRGGWKLDDAEEEAIEALLDAEAADVGRRRGREEARARRALRRPRLRALRRAARRACASCSTARTAP